MHIQSLKINNFRNYLTLAFEPQNRMNILTGKNAQGKSAVLEAIYFLATSKSNRTSRDSDLINVDHDYLRVEAMVSGVHINDFCVEIAMNRKGQKIAKIDSIKQPRTTDILGHLNVVVFASQDIEMVRGEPSCRRRFMNLDISQSNPGYAHSLSGYKKVLMQRNNLLKEIKKGNARESDLYPWDMQLASFGAALICRRNSFLQILNSYACDIYSHITGSAEEMRIIYKPNLQIDSYDDEKQVAQGLLEKLKSSTELDIIRGTTNCGPQRDDFIIEIDGMGARDFASQGQQRSAAISIKLAQMRTYEQLTGEMPVVLLDDVLAELDSDRRQALVSLLCGKCQTLITTTDAEEIPEQIRQMSKIYDISAGTVVPRSQ